MAPKKKVEDEMEDPKKEMSEGAKAIGKAAKVLIDTNNKLEKMIASDRHFGVAHEVDELDKEFSKEELISKLRRKFESGNTGVRVMQIGPDNSLTDVTDKVNPADLASEEFNKNPQSREEALRLLQKILPGLRLPGTASSNATSIAKMEETLAESDRILEHWKK